MSMRGRAIATPRILHVDMGASLRGVEGGGCCRLMYAVRCCGVVCGERYGARDLAAGRNVRHGVR